MKSIYLFLSQWLFVLILFSACTERIPLEFGSTYSRLCVESIITTDTMVQKVVLKQSRSYDVNRSPNALTGAKVTINDGFTNFLFKESADSPGVYMSTNEFFGVQGRTYRLRIENVDIDQNGEMEVYNASSTMQYVMPLDSITLFYRSDRKYTELNCWSQEPEGKNWYVFRAMKNGKLANDTASNWFYQKDDLFNGHYTNGITCQFLRDEKANEKPELGDNITLEVCAVNEDYFNFLNALRSETRLQGNPFGGPPANLPTNVSGKAVGFFATFAISRASKKFAGRGN